MEECLALLKQLGVAYELVTHVAVYTIEEAERALPGRTEIKNLFLQDDKGKRFYLVMMPGHKQLNLKQLASDLGEKKVRFCSEEKVIRMLGVKPGSVSLFCCLYPESREVQIVIDDAILAGNEIGMHPIVNTATVFISPKDFTTVLDALEQPYSIRKL